MLVSFDSDFQALSNELLFAYSNFSPQNQLGPPYGFSIFEDLYPGSGFEFSKSGFRFIISIFFYRRKPLFLIFKLFFRRDHNSPGLPKISHD
uniref:Uncharacterized protein n=1 Tax=Meloidogyne enterolobii TaxID=390850 RepID=A0A6V7XU60_MELEN|nr:unnamed protein product [Meloidogyne enterolobii]